MRIVLYQRIVQPGGTFTFDRNFTETFGGDHQITYLYEAGDERLIREVGKHAVTVRNTQVPIECDLCIFSSISQAKHSINAKVYAQMLHTDLKAWNVKYAPSNASIYVAVGESVARSFKEQYGLDAIVVPNILGEPRIERVLRLMTASRIAEGKGFARIAKLAKALKDAGKPFIWEIYGDGSLQFITRFKYETKGLEEINLMGNRNPIQGYMLQNDYVVQLSDSEGFCYSVHEALQVGKPVIVTRWEGVEKVIKDGINGYILEMDLSNLDVDRLCNSIPQNVKLDLVDNKAKWDQLFKSI